MSRSAARQASAARRQAARYRRVLEEVLQLVNDRLLEHRDDVVAYRVAELVAPALAGHRPHGQEGD